MKTGSIPRLVLTTTVSCLIIGPVAGLEDGPEAKTKFIGERIVTESDNHGGLIVQVGCNNAEGLLSLAEAPNTLVQGLVRDGDGLQKVRNGIRKSGFYGRVSAVPWEGPSLPYADAMVNLLVVKDERVEAKEIDRVLAPLGVVWTLREGVWKPRRKAWPDDLDAWTHARYDATGNAVSKDRRVGPPQSLQWEASPRWNRGVKTSGLVTTQGRIFYILDDSHFAARSRSWSLIARDAFNGIQLWRHELPSWLGAQGGKKVGPAQVNRRLVASDDHVYVTLGETAPVSVLNAATGELLRTLEETGQAEELLLSGGILVVLVNPNTAAGLRRGVGQKPMRLVAFNPDTGKRLWSHSDTLIMPLTLAADGKQAVYHDGEVIKSFDLKSGASRWTSPPTGQKIAYRDQANADSPGAEKSTIVLAPEFAPTLIIYDDVVAFAGGRQLNVVSAVDGSELWRSDYAPSNYSVPVDLFGFEGSLWGPDTKMNLWRPLDDNLDVNAYDPLTGTVKKSVTGKYGFRFQHHRCHQMKVVDNKVVAGRAGIEFLDTDTGEVAAHHWMRGSCYFGVLPANGRLYVPPHDCACYVRAKLAGFFSLNSNPPLRSTEIADDQRLQVGPAYGKLTPNSALRTPHSDDSEDWPTYRHDASRSGRSGTKVGSELLLGWSRKLGGKLTSPVIADNRVYLASTDAHTLHALDATSGEPLWQATLDGRIDSPPTIHEGLVLLGCRDGTASALRASDGALVWRFVASPQQRLIVAHGQLESAWPVSGSVVVAGDIVYFAAGRSSYLDGGIRLYGLEPHTGKKLVDTVLSSRNADGSELLDQQGVEGYLNDVLSCDGERIFMRHQVLDLQGNPKQQRVPHLHSPDGFLSSDTTNRILWTYAPMYTSPHQGAFYDLRLSRMLFPSGRMLVEDDEYVFGYGQNRYDRPAAETGGQWALFSAAKKINVPLDLSAVELRKVALRGEHPVEFRWWKKLPIQVRAMVKTKDVLFVAGPQGTPLTSQAALDGKASASLLAIAPADGRVLADMTIPAAPTWDGMAAAGGNLYLALADGQILCLWPADSGRPGTPLSPAACRAALPPVETAPEPELVGRWRFDEGNGMLARDCSGRGHDAEVSAGWGEGDFGICLVADGVPRAAVIPDAPHLQFGNDDFTLALQVKVDDFGVRLLGKEAFPDNWWVINLLDNGRAELVLGEGRGAGRSVRAPTAQPLVTDAWSHLVVVVDRQAGEVRWYLDGTLDSRHGIPETMTRGLHAAGAEIAIPSTHKPFQGLIGDFRIYRQALTDQRVTELFQEAAPYLARTEFRTRD